MVSSPLQPLAKKGLEIAGEKWNELAGDKGVGHQVTDWAQKGLTEHVVPAVKKVGESETLAGAAVRTAGDAFNLLDKVNRIEIGGVSGDDIDEAAMQVGGSLAQAVNIDPRLGMVVGMVLNPLDPIGVVGDAKKAFHLLRGGEGFGSMRRLTASGKLLTPNTRAYDISTLKDTKKFAGDFFQNIYGEGKSAVQKANIAVKQTYRGGGSITSTHVSKRAPKLKREKNISKNIGLQGAPHHFSLDDELALIVSNTSDAPEFVKELNKLDIYPGNHPRNFIMAYHDNTITLQKAQKKAISDLWEGVDGAPTNAQLDKFLKTQGEGKLFGIGQLGRDPSLNTLIELSKGVKGKDWSKILPPGKTMKDVKLPNFILGVDHQDLIHGAINQLPSRKKLIELAQSHEWLTLSTKARAGLVAEVARQQQNIALHVNHWRLEKIKKAMNFNPAKHDWTDIQTYMMTKPGEAATLDWHKTSQIGTGMKLSDMTKELPFEDAKAVQEVFNLERLPRTGELLGKPRPVKRGTTKDAAIKDVWSKDPAFAKVKADIEAKLGKGAIYDPNAPPKQGPLEKPRVKKDTRGPREIESQGRYLDDPPYGKRYQGD